MADRYWVGGTAAWDGTAGTKWALTSGGTGGEAVPTSADDVFFSAASTGTCTISTGNTGAKSINCTGFTGTLTGTAAITVSGSITLVAGMTYSYTGTTTINATATITSASKTFGAITINASGGTVTLASALVTQATSTVTLTNGTLDLNNFNLTAGSFTSSNSNTRAISFGSGNILLSRTSGTLHLDMRTATNFTWTGTGAFVRNNTPATFDVRFGNTSGGTASNAPNLTVGTGGSNVDIISNSWFKDVNFTGFTGTASTAGGAVNIAGSLTWSTGGTFWSSGTTNFVGSGTFTSAGKLVGPITINGAGITVTLNGAVTCANTTTVTLTQGTLNLDGFTLSAGIFSSSNSNTRSIAFGTGNIALTSASGSGTSLDMGTATNFTLTGTGGFTRNQVATTTLRFGTIGGTASNAPNLTVTGSTGTLTIDGTASGSWFKNFILTGSSCSVPASSVNIAGNLSLGTNGSAYPGLSATFVASGTFTGNGTRAVGNLTIAGSGITVTLATALYVSSVLTLTEGTFNAANFNVTTERFSSSNSNTRTLNMGSGLWIVNGSGAAPAVWNTLISTNLTLNPSTSTISLSNSSAKTFVGGGLTYYNLRLSGVGALTISGSNTFNDITNTVQPSTVTFTAGSTQTVSNFSLAGTAGNLITINSDTPGSRFTLSKSSGTVNAQYLAIQDSNATGGAIWNSLLTSGNVNNGNNAGWIFTPGNMFLMFI